MFVCRLTVLSYVYLFPLFRFLVSFCLFLLYFVFSPCCGGFVLASSYDVLGFPSVFSALLLSGAFVLMSYFDVRFFSSSDILFPCDFLYLLPPVVGGLLLVGSFDVFVFSLGLSFFLPLFPIHCENPDLPPTDCVNPELPSPSLSRFRKSREQRFKNSIIQKLNKSKIQ